MRRILMMVAVAHAIAAGSSQGQLIRLEGSVDHPAVNRLREVVRTNGYLLLNRDTILPVTSRIPVDLVIVGADVRMEGSIAGSVLVLPGGDFFLRPGARVEGSVVTLGGVAYVSQQAVSGSRLELPADIGLELTRSGEQYTLHLAAPPAPATVRDDRAVRNRRADLRPRGRAHRSPGRACAAHRRSHRTTDLRQRRLPGASS